MAPRRTVLAAENEWSVGSETPPCKYLKYPFGHVDDAFVSNLGTPEPNQAGIQIDLPPFEITDLPTTGTCIEQNHNKVVEVLKGGHNFRSPFIRIGKTVSFPGRV